MSSVRIQTYTCVEACLEQWTSELVIGINAVVSQIRGVYNINDITLLQAHVQHL